jgi:hypothetical protein
MSKSKDESIYRGWAYQIAENPSDIKVRNSIPKAVAAFEAWGIKVPDKLAAFIAEQGIKL